MTSITAPRLDLHSSALLRASLDERFFRIWDYEDSHAAGRHVIRDEVEVLVTEILEGHETSDLIELGMADQPLRSGYSHRGPKPFSPRDGGRPVAFLILERELWAEEERLAAMALDGPSPTDRVFETVNGLFDQLTSRDGLLPLRPEMILDRPGNDRYFVVGDHAVFPHPEIREARELVGDLCALVGVGADIKMAIDPHRVVRLAHAKDVFLADYWFGVKLKKESIDDPYGVGDTRHERRVDQHDDFTFPLIATDFAWALDGSIKTLRIEETVPRESRESRTGPYLINRFLHSQRDISTRRFIHLDGAAKGYDHATYEPTIDNPGADKSGEPKYRKMFRIDGEIDDLDWGRIVGHFYRRNELVIEYFGDVLDERG